MTEIKLTGKEDLCEVSEKITFLLVEIGQTTANHLKKY